MVSLAIASVLMAVMAVITAAGMRAIRLTFYILFTIMMVGMFTIIGVFAMTSTSSFAIAFNTYSAGLGTTYQGLIDAARKAGWVPSSNISAVFAALPVTTLMYGGFTYIVYLGGEVKRTDRTLTTSIFGTLLIGLVMFAGTAFAFTQAAGYDFLNAGAYLAFAHPEANPLTVPPVFPLFVSVLTIGNPVLFWFILLAFVVSYMIFIPAYYLVITRNIFAWSFDRVAPSAIADVNERFHTPVKAIIVTFIAAEIACAVLGAHAGRFLMVQYNPRLDGDIHSARNRSGSLPIQKKRHLQLSSRHNEKGNSRNTVGKCLWSITGYHHDICIGLWLFDACI